MENEKYIWFICPQSLSGITKEWKEYYLSLKYNQKVDDFKSNYEIESVTINSNLGVVINNVTENGNIENIYLLVLYKKQLVCLSIWKNCTLSQDFLDQLKKTILRLEWRDRKSDALNLPSLTDTSKVYRIVVYKQKRSVRWEERQTFSRNLGIRGHNT